MTGRENGGQVSARVSRALHSNRLAMAGFWPPGFEVDLKRLPGETALHADARRGGGPGGGVHWTRRSW